MTDECGVFPWESGQSAENLCTPDCVDMISQFNENCGDFVPDGMSQQVGDLRANLNSVVVSRGTDTDPPGECMVGLGSRGRRRWWFVCARLWR